MNYTFYIVNTFTNELARGNPAGVIILDSPAAESLMQTIAFEIGKSETAFILPGFIPSGPDENCRERYSIRWFTPLREVPLCGHATMAAAEVLFSRSPAMKNLEFTYKGGVLEAGRSDDGSITMDFPLDLYSRRIPAPEYSNFFGIEKFKDCIVGKRTGKTVLILDQKTDLESVRPDFTAMLRFQGEGSKGIGISKESDAWDFETRYFNPWYGVNEDPVTGTVHTLLAAYWSRKLGKTILTARQKSLRPGTLRLEVKQDGVKISGDAIITVKGEFIVP